VQAIMAGMGEEKAPEPPPAAKENDE